LGGWLLEHFWWGSVFLINVPLVLAGLAALAWLLPAAPGRKAAQIDIVGIALSSVGLVALTYGLVQTGEHGWTAVEALAPVLVGLSALVWFGWYLSRTAHPLVDPVLFRSSGFTWG